MKMQEKITFRILTALVYVCYSVLYVSGEEEIRLQELEGNNVTIHTGGTGVQTDAQIMWFYGQNVDIKIVDSLVFKGETYTDYNKDRFRDRLQMNRTSGSLTIRNISSEDSGLYKLHIITGNRSAWTYSVNVYAKVSEPNISLKENHSRESCSPLCTVENGKNVSLFWYEENEIISSITSSNSSEHLHLPLNKTNLISSTYTCVAANPVSNHTVQLNITQLCYKADPAFPIIPIIAIVITVGVTVVFFIVICNMKKKTWHCMSAPEEPNREQYKVVSFQTDTLPQEPNISLQTEAEQTRGGVDTICWARRLMDRCPMTLGLAPAPHDTDAGSF